MDPRHGADARGPRGSCARTCEQRIRHDVWGDALTTAPRGIADLELECLETGELPAHDPCDDVDHIAGNDGLGEVRTPEGDPVEDISIAPERQGRVIRAGDPDARDGEAQDRDERVRVAGPV